MRYTKKNSKVHRRSVRHKKYRYCKKCRQTKIKKTCKRCRILNRKHKGGNKMCEGVGYRTTPTRKLRGYSVGLANPPPYTRY